MIRLIQFLFSGCFYQWEAIRQVQTDYDFGWASGNATNYTLRCKKCGAMKTFLAR
jgi:uncharacterized protein CbrC (UPF0167 family)